MSFSSQRSFIITPFGNMLHQGYAQAKVIDGLQHDGQLVKLDYK